MNSGEFVVALFLILIRLTAWAKRPPSIYIHTYN
jgi:hypothetical protein